jgi:hypothetical protein
MIGRQSDLIVTNDDLSKLETLLRSRSDVQLLSSRTNEGRNTLLPLKSLVVGPADIGVLRICYFAPSKWTPDVSVVSISDVKSDVDVEHSEVIEYWRSYCAKGEIQAGRYFYTPVYWDEGEWAKKSPEFIKWAESLVRTIKKSLIRDKASGKYIGHDAAQKIASGELKLIS